MSSSVSTTREHPLALNPEDHISWLARAWAELDPITTPGTISHTLWALISLTGGVLFYGRFYMQWIVSEIRRKSVVPTAFWYMSSVGSVSLLAYGAHISSPVGTLSQCINVVIYARNLVHIWRGKGKLSPVLNVGVHLLVAAIALTGLGLVGFTWWHEYHSIHADKAQSASRAWFWILVGVAGTALFACRFIVQWLVSESQGKSVVPVSFWYISVAAAVLQSSSFFQQQEWVYGIGVASNVPVYLRNLYLIRKGGSGASISGE